MRSNSDTQLLSEQYTNSIIKRHIAQLVKEGKSKDEIQQILQEAGFLNNIVQGAKNAYQNYVKDPMDIYKGQGKGIGYFSSGVGYDKKGQEARQKGQDAYNRQMIRKFTDDIQGLIKSITKYGENGTADINKQMFNKLRKTFEKVTEQAPNIDPNVLIKQFDIVINTLKTVSKNSVAKLSKGFENAINEAQKYRNGLAGGMQQQQPPQQQQQQQQPPPQQQQAPQQQQQPPQAGSFQGAGGAPQNVVGVNNNSAQLQTASTTPRIYKKDYVLMENAYEQVKKNGLVVD